MNYSVCIDSVFQGMDTLEAIRSCHALGYDKIEFWSWWDKDLDAMAACLKEHKMQAVTFCSKFISLIDPACRKEFLQALREGIAAARKLGVSCMIAQTGPDMGTDRDDQMKLLEEGLRECLPILEEEDFTLLLEPLNTRVDHRGYFIASSDEMAQLIRRVGSSHFRLLFDIYHQQISEGDLLRHLSAHLDLIGHLHAAGNPGRHELDLSEIQYPYLLREVEKLGYARCVGLEYFPAEGLSGAEAGLGRLKQILP